MVGDGTTNATAVTLSGTADPANTVQIYEGTQLVTFVIADATGNWTTPIPITVGSGTHTFTAKETDIAGHTSPSSFDFTLTVDIQAPNTPTISSFATDNGIVGDHLTNDRTLNLTGTGEANTDIKVFDGGTFLGTTTVAANGTWAYLTSAMSDGLHTFTANDTDAAGNTSMLSNVFNVTVDTVAPADVITSDVLNKKGTFTLAGTSEAAASIKVFDGATLLGSTTVGSNGQWNFTTGVLSNSTVHVFTSTATDAAGNIGPSTGAAIYGTSGNNTLSSTSGNDLLTGNGGADNFVFAGAAFGKDVVADFLATGANHDFLQFDHTVFANFAAVQAHSSQVGPDVVISFDAADAITLMGVKLAHLAASDFHFI